MAEYPEKEMLFRSALRQQILGRSQLVRQELSRGTKFLYSEQYPTQVLNTQLGRFIRVNQADINEDSISNLLKDEDVDKAFLWIILKLSVTYNFMTNKLTD